MLNTRIIPVLLLSGKGLYKTIKFKNPRYIGDPINAVKILNDKEVDELVFLDISATPGKREPDYHLLQNIATECFMPFGYGGGIRNLESIEKLFKLGVEKVILNTIVPEKPELITEAARIFGNQSIVVSIDVKKNWHGKYEIYLENGRRKLNDDLIDYSKKMQDIGAGEIILNSIDRDGMRKGYDLNLLKMVSGKINIPVVASGGAGCIEDFSKAVKEGGASAVAAGSFFVFHGIHQAVLITYPSQQELKEILE